MDILSTIQNQYLSFSSKEKQIADYILKENASIKNINITILSKKIGVSNGTITRFCKKIGCDSFSNLKVLLSSQTYLQETKTENDHINDVYDFYQTVIERSNKLICQKTLLKIVSLIRKSKKISIYGIGNSGLSATELMLRLLRMGFNVQSITDPHLMIMNSSIMSKGDVLIIISVSGETIELVKALNEAKKNKAYTVCITSFSESILAKNSDSVLTIYNSIFIDKERFINSQFGLIYAIDLISTLLLKDYNLKLKMQTTVDTVLRKN